MPDLRAVMQQAAADQAAQDARAALPPPPSTSKDPMRIPRWAMLLGAGIGDAASTTAALKRPGTREANGLMAGIAKRPAALYGVKLGTNAGIAALLDKTHKTNPKLANAMAVGLAALQAAVAVRNTKVGKK